jgi:hypothetical protein
MLYANVSNPDKNSIKKRIALKTTKVACNTCCQCLGEFIETEPKLSNGTEIKHLYVCPCGGESFVVKSSYNAFFHSSEGLIVTSITNIGTNKYKSILEKHDEKNVSDFI